MPTDIVRKTRVPRCTYTPRNSYRPINRGASRFRARDDSTGVDATAVAAVRKTSLYDSRMKTLPTKEPRDTRCSTPRKIDEGFSVSRKGRKKRDPLRREARGKNPQSDTANNRALSLSFPFFLLSFLLLPYLLFSLFLFFFFSFSLFLRGDQFDGSHAPRDITHLLLVLARKS